MKRFHHWFFAHALTLSLGLGLGLSGLVSIEHADAAEASPVDGKKKSKETTGIEWEVTPKHVQVFLDGKKLGNAEKLGFTATKPGKHVVRLLKDKDETEMEIEVKKGQTLKFTFSFDEG